MQPDTASPTQPQSSIEPSQRASWDRLWQKLLAIPEEEGLPPEEDGMGRSARHLGEALP